MAICHQRGLQYTDSDQFVRIAFLTSLTNDPVTSMVPMGLIIAIEDDTHSHTSFQGTQTRGMKSAVTVLSTYLFVRIAIAAILLRANCCKAIKLTDELPIF